MHSTVGNRLGHGGQRAMCGPRKHLRARAMTEMGGSTLHDMATMSDDIVRRPSRNGINKINSQQSLQIELHITNERDVVYLVVSILLLYHFIF